MRHSIGKRLTALGVCCLLATTAAFAAQTVTKTITVEYAGIKMVIDGVQVTPKDANGLVIEPFIYNGTTYLPVRAVGEAVGKDVGWDGTTKTVYLGDVPGKTDEAYLQPYNTMGNVTVFFGDPSRSFSMMGVAYTNGFRTEGNYDGTALYNLNGRYSTITFDVGHVDGADDGDSKLYISVDGDLQQEIKLTADMQTRHISLPVNGALQLKLEKINPEMPFGTVAGDYGVGNVVGVE